MTYIDIEIPVKRANKRWLEFQFGSPSMIPGKTIYGKVLYLLLQRQPCRESASKYRAYPETLQVTLKSSLAIRKGTTLTKTGVTDFNSIVEDCWKAQMRTWHQAKFQT